MKTYKQLVEADDSNKESVQNKVARLQKQIESLHNEIYERNIKISELQKNIDDIKAKYSKRGISI